DRITGETIWILGGENSDFAFVNENLEFSRIHDVRPVPGQQNHYTLFDNGRDRSNGPQFSRAVEYKLDLDAKTAEKVWEYRHSPDLYSSYCGGTQPFKNGNRFISWANNDYFNEVNSSEELVYEMYIPGFSCSRGRRCEWEGKMLHPYLILENMSSIIRLIFNKFGDPNVAYYNIYAGTNKNSLAFFDSTKQTYMDIDALDLGDGARYFFKVTAVDFQNIESEASQIENVTIRVIRPGENAVQNGDFQSTDNWLLRRRSGAIATGTVNGEGYYEIKITNGGANLDAVQLQQDNLLVMQGKDYIFEFDAYASSNRAIDAQITSADDNQNNYGKISTTGLTRRPQHFRYTFPMSYPTDTEARVVFNCGGSAGDVFIDNVSLTYKNSDNTLSPLPSPWQSRDIGSPAIPGEAGMREEKFLIRASGNDIWDQRDAFHFVYQELEGDGEIITRVYSLEESDPWSKAGVMMRNSLQASSSHAMMILSADNGAAFQRRVEDGGNSTHTAGSQTEAPHWVRLVRKGDVFSGYESSDGLNWQLVDSETIDMRDRVYIGLPVTSHNDDVICQAQIDHVTLIGKTTFAGNEKTIPRDFYLSQAFPNPFNPVTTIHYDLPLDSEVSIVVYDIQGRRVRTLVDRRSTAGSYNVVWDGTNDGGESVASGVYLYHFNAGMYSAVHKVTLLK
ncbi:carbohydrate binding domain-containing protein, partial [candidate division KSB1 bacterium]|nr:carbohydrate binding domain-containing protein [candidate division KSB1 bacterium]